MPHFKDLTGENFGRWTVLRIGPIHRQPSGKHLVTWVCECECGEERTVLSQNLRSGTTQSCGCIGKERLTKHGGASRGKSKTYRAWCAAKERCAGTRDIHWKYYASRGIKMAPRWASSFAEFRKDMGECPPGYSLERVDNDGDYEQGNCTWIPKGQQAKNRRTVYQISWDGKTQCLADWAREFSVPYETIRHQYVYRGISFGDIATRYS